MMKESKEYPGFFEVEAKFKIGDVVDWCISYNNRDKDILVTCVITDIYTLVDHEDDFEVSYTVREIKNDKIHEKALLVGSPYESELTLNKKYKRDGIIKDLLNGIE